MTKDQIKRWMARNFEKRLRAFGLGWWRVTVEYCEIEQVPGSTRIMECQSLPEYERSTIRIDCGKLIDFTEEEFVASIEHEILHIAHSPFEMFRTHVETLIHADHVPSLRVAYSHSAEMTLRHLERLVQTLRSSAK